MFERKIRTKNLYIAELVKVKKHENHKFLIGSFNPKKYILVKQENKTGYMYKDVLNKSEYFLCNCYKSYPGAIAIDIISPLNYHKSKIKYSDAEEIVKSLNTKTKK